MAGPGCRSALEAAVRRRCFRSPLPTGWGARVARKLALLGHSPSDFIWRHWPGARSYGRSCPQVLQMGLARFPWLRNAGRAQFMCGAGHRRRFNHIRCKRHCKYMRVYMPVTHVIYL